MITTYSKNIGRFTGDRSISVCSTVGDFRLVYSYDDALKMNRFTLSDFSNREHPWIVSQFSPIEFWLIFWLCRAIHEHLVFEQFLKEVTDAGK
jgi:hypothetical protein